MSNEAIQPASPREEPTPAQIAAAKQYAQEHGYTEHAGGWICNATDRAIAPDWATFASYLIVMGVKSVREAKENTDVTDEARTEMISVPCTAREYAIINMAAIASGTTPEDFTLRAALRRATVETRRQLGQLGEEA